MTKPTQAAIKVQFHPGSALRPPDSASPESKVAPKDSEELDRAAGNVPPPAKLPKVLRELSGEEDGAAAARISSSWAVESSVARIAFVEWPSASPCNSDMESDAGGAGETSFAAGVFGIRGAKFSRALSRGVPGFMVVVADAAGWTSSWEPMKMKDGAGFAGGALVGGVAAAGFEPLAAGFASMGLGGRALGVGAGAQEMSCAGFGGSGTDGIASIEGIAIFPAGAGPSDSKATPQYPGCRLVNSTST